MGRPRKYASDADALAARRQADAQRKRSHRAAEHALKKDPTKRKDAAVNMEAYPLAPINDDTMIVIRMIMKTAGELAWNGRPSNLGLGRLAAALMIEWEDEHRLRLPALAEEVTVHDHTAGGVPITSSSGEGYEWNRLHNALCVIVRFMERHGENKLAAERRDEADALEAKEAGLSVEKLRAVRDDLATRQWKTRTQRAYRNAKSERSLAKRNARIERDGVERMRKQESFGRF